MVSQLTGLVKVFIMDSRLKVNPLVARLYLIVVSATLIATGVIWYTGRAGGIPSIIMMSAVCFITDTLYYRGLGTLSTNLGSQPGLLLHVVNAVIGIFFRAIFPSTTPLALQSFCGTN